MRVQRVQHDRVHNASAAATSDTDLVAAARIDRQAIGSLYERYRDDLLRYTFYGLGTWDEAADATQQIFANAIAGLPGFVDRDNSFRSWLFRIAHNEVSTRQKRRTHRPQDSLSEAADIVDLGPSPEDLTIAADDHQRLWLLLEHLPADRRRVCELRLAGLHDSEIALVLGKSEGAVRTAQSRAVSRLRDLMGVRLTPTRGNDG